VYIDQGRGATKDCYKKRHAKKVSVENKHWKKIFYFTEISSFHNKRI
jgi:hypothetical protein